LKYSRGENAFSILKIKITSDGINEIENNKEIIRKFEAVANL